MPFASMTQDDVAAFYELLDEYFESRKELFASWVNPNGSAAPTSSVHNNAPVHSPTPVAPTSGRMTAPPPPISRSSPAPAPPSAPSYAEPAAAPAKPGKPVQPTNKYGITVPSMSDFKDPRFQQGFKFAGSAASAAGGLINKHVMGNAPKSPEPAAGGAPAPASKPSGLAGKAMSYAQNKIMAPPAAPNNASNTSVPLPPPAPASPRGNGRGIGSATAQYDYSSSESGDLSFKQGDSITLLAKESADWWRGEFRGRQGLFPASYVSED